MAELKNQEVEQNVQEAQNDIVEQKVEKIAQEAVEAVNLIAHIVELVDKKEKEKALEEIANVLGKLEVLIAKDPNLQLVPVDVEESVVDYDGSVEDVEFVKSEVVALIKAGEVQAARDIMMNLASELDIYITALPIGSYPIIIKAIVPLIEQDKFDDAKKFLIEALETLVIQKIVIPLPILRAEELIKKANEIANKEDANKDELKELLAVAKEQIKLAQALGYQADYDELYEEIEKLEKILGGDESTKDIFKTLKEKLSSIMTKFNQPKEAVEMPKAENKEEK
ncbi:MAG: YfdX family protein [Epsilonproteobacteria bacterium]|nr:YfdX family protein [Campylobacterota bacterium]